MGVGVCTFHTVAVLKITCTWKSLIDCWLQVVMEKFTFKHEVGQDFRVTAPMQEAFQKWGCLLVRGLFSAEEMAELAKCFDTESFQREVFTRGTGKDGGFQMALWWQPGDDTCGLITRCRRMVDTLQILLGGQQVYHLR